MSFACQNHTIQETADKIRRGEQVSCDIVSGAKLADWLEELQRSRDAIYNARVALAQSEKR